MLRAPKLEQGDTIGLISPSWGGAGAFPHRIEQANRAIEAIGFNLQPARHALNQMGAVSDTPERRAQDIHEMFVDPDIRAIIAAIGGDHSSQLLPHLDFDLIRKHPKIFMGFSDITVLNVAIWQQTKLVTFNGPAILTDFGEYPRIFDYTKTSFLETVASTVTPGVIKEAPAWTEEFLDWKLKQDLFRPRQMRPSPGWNWLKPGYGEGPLVGGCLESLQHIKKTPFWPNWQDAIFFFETSELTPSPEQIDEILQDYEREGVFDQISGLIVGRAIYYSNAQKARLNDVIIERTRNFEFPIVTDMDFGHTAPQFTVPIGCRARIDSDQKTFEILESAVV